jgi:isopentenyl-diphosphate Delta-isomerase
MADLVLVDRRDREIGRSEKLAAHQAPGTLHRAFSVMLLDDDGRLVLQRRARSKYHFAGLWANSCCGHPEPGADPEAAAAQRTFEELGVRPHDLRPCGAFTYQARDEGSGLVEHEYDHVFLGRYTGALNPDPAEVDETRALTLETLESELRAEPGRFSPWLPGVVAQLKPHLT